MLAEFLKDLLQVHRKSIEARPVVVPGLRGKAVVQVGDDLREFETPVGEERRLETLYSVVDYVRDHSPEPGKAEVYVTTNGISVVHGEDRRAGAWCPLDFSDRFLRVTRLGHFGDGSEGPGIFDVDEARRFLRFEVGANSPGAHDIAAKLERLDFSANQSGHAGARQGVSDLGMQVEYATSGQGDVPESFLVTLPVYRTPGAWEYTAEIEFGCNLRPRESKVEIRPLPDGCWIAATTAVEAVAGFLRSQLGEAYRVLRGDELATQPARGANAAILPIPAPRDWDDPSAVRTPFAGAECRIIEADRNPRL